MLPITLTADEIAAVIAGVHVLRTTAEEAENEAAEVRAAGAAQSAAALLVQHARRFHDHADLLDGVVRRAVTGPAAATELTVAGLPLSDMHQSQLRRLARDLENVGLELGDIANDIAEATGRRIDEEGKQR